MNTSRAYDLLSAQYDHQPNNPLLFLDEKIVSEFLVQMNITDKVVADIGCGTGRHWQKIIERKPLKLFGFDVSKKMLAVLKEKFPNTEVNLIQNELLPLDDASIDVLICTLMIAYIKDVKKALAEWDRVLKPGGEILITEYHPEILLKGGDRTFTQNGKTIVTKSYVHKTDEIRNFANDLGWTICDFTEKKIDDDIKNWYEKQNALSLFNRFKNVPLIYGFRMKKN